MGGDPGARSAQRWDVRFGSITYLPAEPGEAQRFTYTTTVAPGMTVAGTGESLGDRDRPDGSRWSGLRFNPASLNWAAAALAVVVLATREGLPSGRTPLRSAPDHQPDVGDLP